MKSFADTHIRSCLRTCSRGLAIAGVFSLALNVLMLTLPLYMMAIYDRVLTSRSGETLLMLSIVAVGALAIVSLLEVVRQLVLVRIGARLETQLGEHVLKSSLAGGGEHDVQGLRYLGQLRQFISSPLVGVLFDLPVAPIYLALLFVVHPHLGWLATIAAILIVGVGLINERMSKEPLAAASKSANAALHKAEVQARNAEVIRAMGMFPHSLASWGASNSQALAAADRAASRNAFFNGASQFLRLLLQIAILGYGAYLVLTDSTLSAGIVFAASIVSARALTPLNQAVSSWRTIASAREAWARLRAQLAPVPADAMPMRLPEPTAEVAVEKLVYRPDPGGEAILKGISFSADAGDAIGVIGPSGAGKSTLARLLVGAIAPTSGTIRIGGDDRANWRPELLGPFVGYVPQDVELFPASVAQNIARMAEEPNAEAVIAAAQLADCHEMIQRLPKGYDTLLGPAGYALSGGQRQRIALARAFYGNPKLIVLDEPNALLDSDGEQALIRALQQARSAGITSIVITHRASVVPALNKILLLRQGQIEAFGPRQEILQRQLRPAEANPVTAAEALPRVALQSVERG